MKHSLRSPFGLAALAAALCLHLHAANPPAGEIDFGKFTPPGGGGEFVEVNLKSNLISIVAKLTEKQEPDVSDLLRSVKSVRVNVIGLDDGNRTDVEQRVKAVRAELDSQGWERIVTAQEKDQDVGVYVKTRGDEAIEGVVVTVLEGRREAVLVNVVGDIKPEKIALLGEKLNIDPLKKVGKKVKKDEAKEDEKEK